METKRYTEVGEPIPTGDHSVSVCLPTWKDTLNYKKHEPWTIEHMKTGYPRFFIPRFVQQVSQ